MITYVPSITQFALSYAWHPRSSGAEICCLNPWEQILPSAGQEQKRSQVILLNGFEQLGIEKLLGTQPCASARNCRRGTDYHSTWVGIRGGVEGTFGEPIKYAGVSSIICKVAVNPCDIALMCATTDIIAPRSMRLELRSGTFVLVGSSTCGCIMGIAVLARIVPSFEPPSEPNYCLQSGIVAPLHPSKPCLDPLH